MPVIYIVEDISEMAKLVAMYLAKSNLAPRIFGTAEEALEALRGIKKQAAAAKKKEGGGKCDLIILDLNLPGMSGFDCLRHISEERLTTAPIVILSARDGDEDIIEALGLGADEFVTKPFSPKVLAARVLSHLRREANSIEQTIHFGEYALMLESCVLKKEGVKIPLSNKEFAVLECLARHNGEALTPERIYDEVWGGQYGNITAIAVYVGRLRRKIEDDIYSPKYIKTVFGKGYMFSIDGGDKENGGSNDKTLSRDKTIKGIIDDA